MRVVSQFFSPLDPKATRVMLLGSGELGKELAISFARLGVEVHAVDRYESAPASQVAHAAYVVDMTDGHALSMLVDRIKPDYIVPEIEALATDELARIEEDTDIVVVPTAQAARLTMDREAIRRLAAEKLGVPTSPYGFADSESDLSDKARLVGFPCVVKPVMSSSGKGQSVVSRPEDIPAAWAVANEGGRVAGSRVIVEGFLDFDYEVTLLTVRAIDPSTGKVATWFCEPVGHEQKNGDYVCSWQPAQMSEQAWQSARSIAARVTNALGGRGVFGVELFVVGDDVYFNEVSPRPHDTGLVTLASQRRSEFDLHARAILGLPVDVTLVSPGASAAIKASFSSSSPSFGHLSQALAMPETDVRLFGKPTATSGRRMGVVVATAEDARQAVSVAKKAAAAITQES